MVLKWPKPIFPRFETAKPFQNRVKVSKWQVTYTPLTKIDEFAHNVFYLDVEMTLDK